MKENEEKKRIVEKVMKAVAEETMYFSIADAKRLRPKLSTALDSYRESVVGEERNRIQQDLFNFGYCKCGPVDWFHLTQAISGVLLPPNKETE